MSATYAPDARNVVRLSLQRDVAQLSFDEFASVVDVVNTTSIRGNPNLEPEKAWKARVEWERRFAARTAVTLAVFADRVEDVHDLLVIREADASGVVRSFDAYGNIGDGRRIGAEIRAATPLGFMGLPNAELRLSGLY